MTAKRLPDFVLIGAPKAGTTAMFRALARHPGIYCSPVKEPRFFAFDGRVPCYPCPGGADNASRIVARESDYLALFRDCPPGSIAGEASSTYLASTAAPANLARHVPRARLVAILRHPVERAYSQWLHQLQEGYEPIGDFEAAWADEDRRMEAGWRPLYAYRGRGFYGRHLERWLGFFPREQLLVLFYEDWQRDPAGTLALVWKHLGVPPGPVPTITRENVSSRQPRWKWLHHRMVENNTLRRWAQRFLPLSVRDAITLSVTGVNLRPGPKLDPAVRARLAPVFHEDIDRVSRLTGRDLASWK